MRVYQFRHDRVTATTYHLGHRGLTLSQTPLERAIRRSTRIYRPGLRGHPPRPKTLMTSVTITNPLQGLESLSFHYIQVLASFNSHQCKWPGKKPGFSIGVSLPSLQVSND